MNDRSPMPEPNMASLRLSARVRGLSERLAGLLETFDSPDCKHGAAFLRSLTSAEPTDSSGSAAEVLEHLVEVWQLDDLDVDLVVLASLPDEHEGYASLLQSLHPRGEPRASTGLAAQLLTSSSRERAMLRSRLEQGPAVRAGLLTVLDDGPCFNRTLLPGPGVSGLVRGHVPQPTGFTMTLDEPMLVDPTGFDRWLDMPSCRRAIVVLRERIAVDIVLVSEDPRTAGERARVLTAAAQRRGLIAELTNDPSPGIASALIILASALDRVPISIRTEKGVLDLAALPGPTITCTTQENVQSRSRRPLIVIDCERLDPLSLREVWAAALPSFAAHVAALAARFPVEPALIRDVAADLTTRARLDGRACEPSELHEAIRLRVGTSLRPGMRLRRPSVGWDRLILPAERLEQLREALARVRQQARVIDEWGFLDDRPGARGVRMLFCGPPGTGKTLSAEVLAHELETDLLIVDLSRLVSKWIGETEKNLAEVFAVAERSRAVLLFDEADALFGKRTEISDAHDRYANLETAYLLMRLEQYEGLAVLATNLRRNLDAAFMRRLEFVIEYELPNPAERLALWQAHLPSAAPLDADVNLRELASFYSLAGGLIRNAAVAAAFLAAEEGGSITRAQLLRAIRREYEKTGAAFPGSPPKRGRT